jgi:hypothetical protein
MLRILFAVILDANCQVGRVSCNNEVNFEMQVSALGSPAMEQVIDSFQPDTLAEALDMIIKEPQTQFHPRFGNSKSFGVQCWHLAR